VRSRSAFWMLLCRGGKASEASSLMCLFCLIGGLQVRIRIVHLFGLLVVQNIEIVYVDVFPEQDGKAASPGRSTRILFPGDITNSYHRRLLLPEWILKCLSRTKSRKTGHYFTRSLIARTIFSHTLLPTLTLKILEMLFEKFHFRKWLNSHGSDTLS